MYHDVSSLTTDNVDEAAVKNFKEFDFTLNNNQLPLNSIIIDSVAANSIVDLNRLDEIVNEDISKFRKECRKLSIVLIKKRLERMAVSLPFLRSLQYVIPTNILDKENKGRCINPFERLIHFLSVNSIITTAVGDKAFQEYSVLISTGEEIGKCSKFHRNNEHMDNFYFKKFDIDDTYRNLAIVLQFIFVLSHSQVSLERGFSLNKGVLKD